MPNINCASCGIHVLPYTSCNREPGFMLCKPCENDINGLNFLKNKYKIIQISDKDVQIAKLNGKIESFKEKIRVMEQENFAGYLKGGVLSNIMGRETAENMQKFNDYVNKVNEKEESLREFVEISRSQTKVKVQNQLQHILVNEAQNLIASAKAESEDNQYRIKSCELQREKIRIEMSAQTLCSSHKRENPESKENPENKVVHKYSVKLIQNIMNAYEAEINEMKMKSAVISQLIQDGQGMVRKWGSEKKAEKKKSKKSKVQESKVTMNTEANSQIKVTEDLIS